MEKQSDFFIKLGYLYIILPIIIFLIGYCNIQTAIVGIIIMTTCSYLLFRDCPKLWIPQNKKEWLLLSVVFLITLIWVFYSGIGGYSYQNADHSIRNPLFEMLVNNQWPVIADTNYYISYYIGFWTPAATISKIFNGNIELGYFIQFIWAILGTFSTFYYITAIFRRKILLPVIIFIFQWSRHH